MTAPTTWFEAMPIIPLTAGCPVRFADPQWEDAIATRVNEEEGTCENWWCGPYDGEPGYRVNLETPLGFGWALRHYWQIKGIAHSDILRTTHMGALSSGHWYGSTSDADRLALARALAEVTPPVTF